MLRSFALSSPGPVIVSLLKRKGKRAGGWLWIRLKILFAARRDPLCGRTERTGLGRRKTGSASEHERPMGDSRQHAAKSIVHEYPIGER